MKKTYQRPQLVKKTRLATITASPSAPILLPLTNG
ncbi:putative RiPP precursor [Mesorhizobium sp. INR15]|nr:putative RiPP precursor [Mesorhizobium sp. INR15]